MIVPHRLRAPRQHGAVLAEPPLTEAGSLLAANRERLRLPGFELLGRPWQELRQQAQQTALKAAQDYLRQAGEPLPAVADTPSSLSADAFSLLLAGHQPELFHPGVWVKNFALHGLARRYGATPLHLVIDNDTVKSMHLRVPLVVTPLPLRDWRPVIINCPFDQGGEDVPYEERTVRDEARFARLGEEVGGAMRDCGFVPLLNEFWPEVWRQATRTAVLGERLAAARRTWERRWGCHNLELPVSHLCRTEPFAWFVCHLLTNLPRLHTTYNDCVREYRRQYGIRSRNHPVPDLTSDGDWFEVPLWAWRSGPKRRGRLMVRQGPTGMELRAGVENWPTLPSSAHAFVTAWQELETRGFKVRSRALTNTLYARLFLADLFLHGIGGGKYDELTDEIIRRFYGLDPPAYLVLSATLLLPLPTYPARIEDRRRLAQELRDLSYNPQRYADSSQATIRDLADRKRAWMGKQPESRQERRERFQALRELTEGLRVSLQGSIQEVEEDLADCDRQVQANAILQRRDYTFCLYPEELLRPFCTQFL